MFSRIIPDTWRTCTAYAAPAVTALCLVVAAALPGGLIAHPRAALGLLLVVVAAFFAGVCSAGAVSPGRLLVALLLLRAVGLVAAPTLSDDIFRYVHEGRASRLGLEVPFATAPKDITPPPDDGTSARVNHPEVPAAYPPASQLFLLAAIGAGDVLGAPTSVLRISLALLDALVVLLLFRRREEAPRAFVLYGLHPLPLLEGVIGSHIDVLGVVLVVAALSFATGSPSARGGNEPLPARRARWFGTHAPKALPRWLPPLARGSLVGLAAGVKPIAVLALLGMRAKGRTLAILLAGVLLGALLPTLPYLVVGAPLTRGVVEYGTRWEAQPTVYAVVEATVAAPFLERHARGRFTHAHLALSPFGLLVEEAGQPQLSLGDARVVERPLLLDHRLLARLLCGLLLLIALAVVVARVTSRERRVAYAFAALWLLAPTMHPWYLLWLLPFAALSSSWALLLWAAAAPLAYEAAMRAHATREWQEALWPRAIMLLLLALGAVLDVAAARRWRPWRSRDPAP